MYHLGGMGDRANGANARILSRIVNPWHYTMPVENLAKFLATVKNSDFCAHLNRTVFGNLNMIYCFNFLKHDDFLFMQTDKQKTQKNAFRKDLHLSKQSPQHPKKRN